MEEKNRKPFMDIDFFEDLTGEIPAETPRGVDDVGQRIRKIREEKGLALEELSRLTGFDVQFLSSLEKNEAQPQLGTVIKLSKALDSAFGRLVSGVGEKLYSITRKGEQQTVARSTSQKGTKQAYTYKSLAPEVKGRHMESLIVHLEERQDTERSVHEGEEFIVVYAGRVEVTYGTEVYELEAGDSIYYNSIVPHHVSTLDDTTAAIYAVLYIPE